MKSDIRKLNQSLRFHFKGDAREISEREIATKLIPLIQKIAPQNAIISGYSPIRGEVSNSFVLKTLLDLGYQIALPVVDVAREALTFYSYTPGSSLIKGYAGILEPPQQGPPVHPDVMLTPLLAFNENCDRIGYGAGHHDRTLAEMELRDHAPITIGLAFDFQKSVDFIAESHDYPLDYVVTERHLYVSKKEK